LEVRYRNPALLADAFPSWRLPPHLEVGRYP
jgi:hypothetical protein